jgi:transposase
VARAGPRKVERYGDRFKATAVKLSSLPGVRIKDVAAALDIHPFMLSLWRKQVRDGVIVARGAKLDVKTKAELKRLKELERQYKVLKEEHELLKKGSSPNSGEGGPDSEEEVSIIAVPVGHALDHLDGVVDAFDDVGTKWPAAVRQDSREIGLQAPGERLKRSDAAAHCAAVPLAPEPRGIADVPIGPQRLQVVLEHVHGK